MPVNTVTSNAKPPKSSRVEDLAGGTLVKWDGKPYVILIYDNNVSHIGAVSLVDGGYITPETLVTVIPAGEILTIVVGG